MDPRESLCEPDVDHAAHDPIDDSWLELPILDLTPAPRAARADEDLSLDDPWFR